MKKFLRKLINWYHWNISTSSVALAEDIIEHFDMSEVEKEFFRCEYNRVDILGIRQCIFTKPDHSELVIANSICDTRRWLKQRRRNNND